MLVGLGTVGGGHAWAVTSWVAADAASLATCPAPRSAPSGFPGPVLYVEDLTPLAGSEAEISVHLLTGGAIITGTQNDLGFGLGVRVHRRANGRPDCTVNPAIDKSATSFGFRPPGCTGEACNAVRALVLSTDNSAPIPDGSVLYTCRVTVLASPAVIPVAGLVLSDLFGGIVVGSTRDGNVCSTQWLPPTPPPSPGCPAVRPAPSGASVFVEDLNLAAAGETVVSVRLTTGGTPVVAAQNDLAFGSGVAVLRRSNGRPDCTVNPAIDKSATSFGFRPPGCTGDACNMVRAIVFSSDNSAPIPSGSVLYTCRVSVTGAGGTVPVGGVVLSNVAGGIVLSSGRDGNVCVGPGAVPTPTPLPGSSGCPAVRPAPAGPAVYVEDLNLAASGEAVISLRLATGGAPIAGTQNDLGFGDRVWIRRRANGLPDCAVNPRLGKGATSFAFFPPGCTEDNCSSVRALVFSTDNSDPIEDGSVLYTCRVTVADGGGVVPVTGLLLANVAGGIVPGTGRAGNVCAGQGSGPTATPQPGVVGCPAVRPAPSGPAVYVDDLNLATEGEAVLSLRLATGGAPIAGTQNDLGFGDGVWIRRRANGLPDCAVNSRLGKGATSFAFFPAGCTAERCTSVRALVFSTDNSDPIPDGSLLYTCRVTVTGRGGVVSLPGVVLSNPLGAIVPSTGRGGNVCVASGVAPPSTPTPTRTATRTATATRTRTPTPRGTSTPTRTATPTSTRTRTATATPTRTATPTVSSVPSWVRLNGECRQPGDTGLQPCPPRAEVQIFRCLDSGCGSRELLVRTEVDAAGQFVAEIPGDRASGRRFVEVDLPPLAGGGPVDAADGFLKYRAIDADPSRQATERRVVVNPVTEATTRILEEAGLENYTDTRLGGLASAVNEAAQGLDLAGLGRRDAVEAVRRVAAQSRSVAVRRACTGDCEMEGEITVEGVIRMVNILLGFRALEACEAGDSDGNGAVTVDEVIDAVNRALAGCRVPG